jgi:hypothetical protein
MPYIAKRDRAELDGHIDRLAETLNAIAKSYGYSGAFAGLLNYACTRLALKVLPERRYWVIALVSGVFKNIGDEFYRRYAAPYEDEQIQKNGDVYDA